MRLLERRVLVGLFVGVCALALPAVAAANVNPHLVLTPGGPAGATNQTLNYNLSFAATSPPTDTPTSITTIFPAGLLADSTIDGGKCLTQTAQDPNCQVANGTATLAGVGVVPADEYLVQPPKAADVAGVLLAIGGTATGVADVTVRPADAGLDVAFSGLPTTHQLTDLNLNLTDLRLPSSCSQEQMTVNTVSQNGDNESTNAPFQSTGCPAQPYSPKVAAGVTAFGGPGPAYVSTTITQAADEAASKTIVLSLPSSLQPNLNADAGCLLAAPCQIGTASALTPLAPAEALANGTVTLGLVNGAPTITVAFPAPYALSFQGTINTSNNTVTVQNIPDVPITSLSLNITKSQAGAAFISGCSPSNVGANFSGQGGQSSNVVVPITYVDCTTPPVKQPPTASSAVSGLGSGHPALSVRVVHGTNEANISRVSITLGKGLSFSSAGLVKRCTGHGRHRKCKIVGKGLTISGAQLKTIRLSGGTLVLTFKHAVGQATLRFHGPLLVESKNLQKKVKHHKIKKLSVTVKVTDANGNRTAIALKPKA